MKNIEPYLAEPSSLKELPHQLGKTSLIPVQPQTSHLHVQCGYLVKFFGGKEQGYSISTHACQIRSACLIRLNNVNRKGLYTHSPRSFLRSIRSPSLPLSCRGRQKIDDGLILAYVFTSLKVPEGGKKSL